VASLSRHLSLENWQLVDGTFALDTFGGDDVLLINDPISGFGESWYKNWTPAVVGFYSTGLLQCLRTHFIHVPMRLIYGVTCQYTTCTFFY